MFFKHTFKTFRAFVRAYSTERFSLRQYQEDCVKSCCEAFDEGIRRVGVSLATGGGKTVIFSHLISRVKPMKGQGNCTLIVAHREELLQQAYDKIVHINPGLSVEVERASSQASGVADVTVASIKTIAQKKRLAKFNPNDYKLIIVDEAHHAPSTSYVRLFEHFGALERTSRVAVAGFTATMYRNDTKALGRMFDEIVFHRDLMDMIKSNWLCPAKLTTVSTEIDMSQVPTSGKGSGGDFNEEILSQMVNTVQGNELVVNTWAHHSDFGEKYHSTMIFCVNIQHAIDVANTFREKGIAAEVVTSQTDDKERRRLVEGFKAKKFPVIVNCGVFTEGTDIPNIDMIILNRPTKSPGLLAQMIGRGLRNFPGKECCHIIDMVGKVTPDMATVPSLLGTHAGRKLSAETPIEELEKEVQEEIEKVEEEIDKSEDPEFDLDSVNITFQTYDDIEEFMRGPVRAKQSKFNWLRIGKGTYILGSSNGYLRLDEYYSRGQAKYRLHRYHLIPPIYGTKLGPKYRKVLKFEDVESIQEAITKADEIAMTSNFYSQSINRHQMWRHDPATDAQKATINKLLNQLNQENLNELCQRGLIEVENLSKGQASDYLTKFIIGGPNKVVKWMLSVENKKDLLKQSLRRKRF
ncbi:hypothetical protein TRICI_006459 [Trichomonascus ciferrii]|uniref:ATP-dependent helicase IRC3 n=1 Tax=Trichomonascus ciferrii TaxID=44093 RepID=A0A642UNU7_9ASCO|nr:hypothetical protein TRICI_006459 [Trichomonascus ciferrii]